MPGVDVGEGEKHPWARRDRVGKREPQRAQVEILCLVDISKGQHDVAESQVLAARVLGDEARPSWGNERLVTYGAAEVELERPARRVGACGEASDAALRGEYVVFRIRNSRNA